jgi:IS4 transposase
MTNLATRNGSTAPVAQFVQRNTEETLAELHRPIDPRHFKTRKQGNTTLTYVPWAILAKHLHHRAPGWNWEIQEVKQIGETVVVTGRLSIPTTDGLLHYSAVASEKLDSGSFAPSTEVSASACLRRACALSGLGLDLWN